MKRNTNFYVLIAVLIVLGVAILAGWFYWYQWKPSEIRKECNSIAKKEEQEHTRESWVNFEVYIEDGHDYDTTYTRCLRENGLR